MQRIALFVFDKKEICKKKKMKCQSSPPLKQSILHELWRKPIDQKGNIKNPSEKMRTLCIQKGKGRDFHPLPLIYGRIGQQKLNEKMTLIDSPVAGRFLSVLVVERTGIVLKGLGQLTSKGGFDENESGRGW